MKDFVVVGSRIDGENARWVIFAVSLLDRGCTAGYLVERYTKMKNVYDFLHPISNPSTTYLVGLKM